MMFYEIQARAHLEARRRGLKTKDAAARLLWKPNPDSDDGTPNPQRLAMESKADILGFGGQAGGGKTDLLLGLAATQHKRSVIFRRVFPTLRAVIERSREILNPDDISHSKDSYNESLHRWMLDGGKQIEFESCQYEKDKEKQRGRPRDFYGFDEITEFSRSQFEFIIAWLRSTDPAQRCRVVMTFNPPSDESGGWVVDYFLPWIAWLFPDDFTHPNPARPGELRWYATIDGKETELKNGDPFEHNGRMIKPLSRTFIPSKLSDNPWLADTNYESILQSLPEPLRSQVLDGNFAAAKEANPWQVIPTAWVRAAQERWLKCEQPVTAITGTGVDVARGGRDKTTVCNRQGNYFNEVTSYPGRLTPDGPTAADLIARAIPTLPGYINIDVVGVGSSAYDSLKTRFPGKVKPVNAGGPSKYTDRSGTLQMRNIRAEYYWRMRESLDPIYGDDVKLPPGPQIVADLCAATYKPTTGGILVEPKEDIIERLGRSPDEGESILLANYPGPKRGVFVG